MNMQEKKEKAFREQLDIKTLESNIGYSFQNKETLIQAMVHQSYVVYAPLSIKKILDKCTNQRLEFLGDALLQIHVTKLLYTAFPDYDQGGLTIGRSQLVSNRACLKFAKQLKLEDHLLQIDQDVDKRLGDAFEALIGAIYIDGGQEACDRFLDVQISPIVKVMSSNCPPAAGSSQESQLQVASPVFWGNLMRTAGIMVDPKEAKTHSPPPFAGSASYPSAASPSVSSSPLLNYKGLLQERLCRAGNSSGINPKYIHDSGEFNEQTQMWTFRCRVIYNGESLGSGVASKKKKAEAAAAKDAYERLSVHYTPVD